MATVKFRVAAPFSRLSLTEFQVNSVEEVELVKAFMLRIAPEIARSSLRTDTSGENNAEIALFWAMHLTSKFSQFRHEALKAIETENAAPAPEQEAPKPRGTLHPARHEVDS